ncbi:hypothetical protein [Porphyrobacter sp. YT40]|uniref:hypothetical protein n=1 Tax=Porphyrobacter sp. YT40 TaxID=2547601 RepID=UPI00114135B2|nr:hypothetical protein [Porphyrobacter sp. YT40]QDH33951.1 hypothetical protein E2E27_06150 [Porphyrobacter sp. YT40]
MMPKTSLAVALPFLALAACGSETAEPPAAPATVEVVTADTEGTPGDAPPATATDGTLTAIPAAFHGVWDAETGTCDPASDLRLEIGPETLGFYESQGTVTDVTKGGDGAIVIALAMEGEGEQWKQTVKLQLDQSNDREWLLYLPGPDFDAVRQPIRRKRCPA